MDMPKSCGECKFYRIEQTRWDKRGVYVCKMQDKVVGLGEVMHEKDIDCPLIELIGNTDNMN